MFYWSHKNTHIVLSDEEEMDLLQEIVPNSFERAKSELSPKAWKATERRIFRYLKEMLYANPDAFNRRFVFRSCYDEDAQKMFPILLDGYGRITRRATMGSWEEMPPLESAVENIVYENTDKVFHITLFERPRWFWVSPLKAGHISLPVSSIEKLAGTVDNFFVASTSAIIKFHRDYIRVSILDMMGKSPCNQ